MEEDIEVEGEIEEKDPVFPRRDEMNGLRLLSARFSVAPTPTAPSNSYQSLDDRPIKPNLG